MRVNSGDCKRLSSGLHGDSTTETGGLFPRGLRIGTVTGDLAAPRVQLRAKLDQLEYLSVLFFDDPSRAMIADPPAEPEKGAAKQDVPPDAAATVRGRP